MAKQNLILSATHDMGYRELAPFLESLRATGSTAKVHLFMSGVDARSAKRIEAMGISIKRFHYLHFRRRRPLALLWPLWKKLLAARDLPEKCRLAGPVFYFASLRFVLYHEYLLKHQDQFENVLLTDCRDVYFQRDPFSENLGPGVHCFLEAKRQIIGKCPANSRMVRTAFGPEVLRELADAPVSCAGTLLGDIASILKYLETMVELLCKIITMTSIIDQGVHNFIIHRRLLPFLHLHDNYSSIVFTAGCEGGDSIRLNDRNEIIRQDGGVYSMLHQYDRHAGIRDKLHAKLESFRPA